MARTEYVTVSAKVPRRVKELMDQYGIKPGPVIREALEREVRKKILEEAEKRARRLRRKLSPLSEDDIVRLIREDREAR